MSKLRFGVWLVYTSTWMRSCAFEPECGWARPVRLRWNDGSAPTHRGHFGRRCRDCCAATSDWLFSTVPACVPARWQCLMWINANMRFRAACRLKWVIRMVIIVQFICQVVVITFIGDRFTNNSNERCHWYFVDFIWFGWLCNFSLPPSVSNLTVATLNALTFIDASVHRAAELNICWVGKLECTELGAQEIAVGRIEVLKQIWIHGASGQLENN